MFNYIIQFDKLSRLMKYTVKQLQADFPDDDACLEWLVAYLYPNGITCPKCDTITKHYRVSGRRSYCCSKCGNHLYPLANTIFHRSHTTLTDWFHAIYIMSTNKAGTSAESVNIILNIHIHKTLKTYGHILNAVSRVYIDMLGLDMFSYTQTSMHGDITTASTRCCFGICW